GRAPVEHFNRAIHAADCLGVHAPADLYLARGQAYELLGDFDNARENYERAHAIASPAGEARTEWQCLLALGFLLTGHDYTRAEHYLQRALDVAQSLDDPALLAHSLNRVGNIYANTERQAGGVRMHAEGLAHFQPLGDFRRPA